MTENYTVCNCKKVTLGDIQDALHTHDKFESVLEAFDEVQRITSCSTGCGGCHDKIMDLISTMMMDPTAKL